MSFASELNPLEPTVESYHLRPLATGEVIDRLFAIYRRNFSLFVGISLMPAAVSLLTGVMRILMLHGLHLPQVLWYRSAPVLIETILAFVIGVAAYGISQAATTSAISDVYLGKETTPIAAYRVAGRHWVRFAWLGIVQMLWAGWLPALLFLPVVFAAAGLGVAIGLGPVVSAIVVALSFLLVIPYSMYRFGRVSLSMPASVVEDLRVVASVRRSKKLTQERKFRITVLFLLILAFYLILASFIGILAMFGVRGYIHMAMVQVIELAMNFFTSLILQPLGAIGVALFYFDERVRQEAFDIEFMMQRTGLAVPSPSLEPIAEE